MMKALRILTLLGLLVSYDALAAITFVGGAENSSDGANTTALTVTLPAHATDDVGVCAHHHDDGGAGVPEASLTTATGWTQIIDSLNHTSGSDRVLDIWYKKFTSASETNPVFTTDTSDNRAVVCLVFRGVDTTTQIDATTTTADGGANDDNPNHVDITTANDNAALVLFLNATQHGLTTAGAPSGYTISTTSDFDEDDEIMLSAYLLDAGTAGAQAPGVWTNTGGSGSADTTTATVALRAAVGGSVTFSAGPTVQSTTATSYTISYTTSGSTTVYAVACPPGDSAPSSAQVEAGNCPTAAAESSANKASNGADTITLSSIVYPRHDIYLIPESGGAVSTLADEDRTADTGQEFVELASVSATSPFALATDSTGDTDGSTATITGMTDTSDFSVGMLVDVSAGFATTGPYIVTAVTASTVTLDVNSTSVQANITVSSDVYYNPTVAAGDIIEADSSTSNGDAITWETDGDLSYTDTSGGALTTIDYCMQDDSDATSEFTTPACWTTDDKLYIFNTPPEFDLVDGEEILLWDINVALSGVTMTSYCSDVDAHALSFSLRSGSFETGVSMDSAGAVTGTPTVEDESGSAIVVICQDPGLLAASQTFTQYVVDTWTMPDCVTGGVTVSSCLTSIDSAAPWYNGASLSTTSSCSETVAKDDIISTTPAAGEVDNPLEPLSAVVSTGACPSFDLTGLPTSWKPWFNILNDDKFNAIKMQECDGDGVWASWRAGTSVTPRGSANCVVDESLLRQEADGSAVWARWAPGSSIRLSATLQIDVRQALTEDFVPN